MLMEKVLFESRHRKAEILFGSLLGMMHKFVFIEGGRKLTPKVLDQIVECQPVIEHFPRLFKASLHATPEINERIKCIINQ